MPSSRSASECFIFRARLRWPPVRLRTRLSFAAVLASWFLYFRSPHFVAHFFQHSATNSLNAPLNFPFFSGADRCRSLQPAYRCRRSNQTNRAASQMTVFACVIAFITWSERSSLAVTCDVQCDKCVSITIHTVQLCFSIASSPNKSPAAQR
jgi:hypothetical protein